MFIVTICQEMKWDYEQYLRQPEWFLEILKYKLQEDNGKLE